MTIRGCGLTARCYGNRFPPHPYCACAVDFRGERAKERAADPLIFFSSQFSLSLSRPLSFIGSPQFDCIFKTDFSAGHVLCVFLVSTHIVGPASLAE